MHLVKTRKASMNSQSSKTERGMRVLNGELWLFAKRSVCFFCCATHECHFTVLH